MSKLTKAQEAKIEEAATKLRAKHDEVRAAIDEANAKIREINESMDHVYGEYNEAVQEAAEVRDEIASDLQNDFDEKSEKWQEGDKGQEAQSAISEWEGVDLDEAEFTVIDEIEDPGEDCEHADNLENAPREW